MGLVTIKILGDHCSWLSHRGYGPAVNEPFWLWSHSRRSATENTLWKPLSWESGGVT